MEQWYKDVKGRTWSISDLQDFADREGISLEEFLEKWNYTEIPGNQKPTGQGAPVDNTTAPDTDSKSEDTSLDSQFSLSQATKRGIKGVSDVQEKEKYFDRQPGRYITLTINGVKQDITEETYNREYAGEWTHGDSEHISGRKYPESFEEYVNEIRKNPKFKNLQIKDFDKPTGDPEGVTVVGKKPESVKENEARAIKYQDEQLKISLESEKDNIVINYFNLKKEQRLGYGASKDPEYSPKTIKLDRAKSEQGKAYNEKIKEQTLKESLGPKRYREWKDIQSELKKRGDKPTLENITELFSMREALKTKQGQRVVGGVLQEARNKLARTFTTKESVFLGEVDSDFMSYLEGPTEDYKYLRHTERLKRKEDEKEFEKKYGRPLVRTEIIDGKTYRPSGEVVYEDFEKTIDKRIEDNVKSYEGSKDRIEKRIQELKDFETEHWDKIKTAQENGDTATLELLKNDPKFLSINDSWNGLKEEKKILQGRYEELLRIAQRSPSHMATIEQLSKNYNLLDRLYHNMEQAFFGSSAMLLGKGVDWLGELIDLIPGIDENVFDDLTQMAVDYNKRLQVRGKEFPEALDIKLSDPYSMVEGLINNAPSIAALMLFKGKAGPGVSVRQAARGPMAAFFTMEAGGQFSNLEIQQREAEENIKYLNKLLDETEGEVARNEIIQQIANQDALMNLTEWQKAFNGLSYGTIAMYAERLGTLNSIANFSRMSRAIGTKPMRKLFGPLVGKDIAKKLGVLKGFGIGIGVIEPLEEGVTQIGHNFMDNLIGEKKSLIEGLDAEFFKNVVLTSAAVLGPSGYTNIYNSMSNVLKTEQEMQKQRALADEIWSMQQELNGIDGRTVAGRKLQAEINEKIKESALDNTLFIGNKAEMSNADIEALFDIELRMEEFFNESRQEGYDALSGGRVGSYARNKMKYFNEEINKLIEERNSVYEKYNKQFLKKLLKDDKELQKEHPNFIAEAQFNNGMRIFSESILKNMDGINTVKIHSREDLLALQGTMENNDYTELERGYRGLSVELGGKGYGATAAMMGNTVYLFEENFLALQRDTSQSKVEREIGGIAPLHELGHIQARNAGIIKDDALVGNARAVITGIIADVKSRHEAGKMTDKQYKAFNDRIKLYRNKDGGYKHTDGRTVAGKEINGVDVDELLQLVGDFKTLGILPKSSLNNLYSLKAFINNFLSYANNITNKKTGEKNGSSLLFKINTAADVNGFINSWQRKAQLLMTVGKPEKKEGKLKLSKTQGGIAYFDDLAIEDMFKQHDHTYQYSDDRNVFNRGRRQEEIIENKIKELGGWTQELVNTWNKYAPKSMQMNFEDLTIEERGGPITDKDKTTRLEEARRISKIKFSKTLTSEQASNVEQQILNYKEGIKSGELEGPQKQIAERKIYKIVDPVINKFINAYTSGRKKGIGYQQVPQESKRVATFPHVQATLKSNLQMLALKYDGRQGIEKFIFNSGYLKMQSLLKELGVAQPKERGGPGVPTQFEEKHQKETIEQPEITKKKVTKKKKFADNLELDKDVQNEIILAVGKSIPQVTEGIERTYYITKKGTGEESIVTKKQWEKLQKNKDYKNPRLVSKVTDYKKYKKDFEKLVYNRLKPIIGEYVNTTEKYKEFLEDNFNFIFNKLPQSVINKKYFKDKLGKGAFMGQQVGRETIGAGKGIMEKVKVSKEDFVNYFTNREMLSATRSDRKTSLIRTLINELSFDTTLGVLKGDIEVKDGDKTINVQEFMKMEGFSADYMENIFLDELSKTIERDNLSLVKLEDKNYKASTIKFSKTIDEALQQGMEIPELYDFVKLAQRNPGGARRKNSALYQAFQDDMDEKGWRGLETRDLVYFTLAQKDNPDITIKQIKAASNQNDIIDLRWFLKDQPWGTEIKAGIGGDARFASGRILSGDLKTFKVAGHLTDAEYFNEILDDIINSDKFKNTVGKGLKAWAKKVEEVTGEKVKFYKETKTGINATTIEIPRTLQNELVRKGHQAMVAGPKGKSMRFKIPMEFIRAYYRNKDKGYKQKDETFKDKHKGAYIKIANELFNLGEDPLNTNAPLLEGQAYIEFRLKWDPALTKAEKAAGKSSAASKKGVLALTWDTRIESLKTKGLKLESLHDYEKVFENQLSNKQIRRKINEIIEQSKGVPAQKDITPEQMKAFEKKNKQLQIWIPSAAEDLRGLIYRLVRKGKIGEADLRFYDKVLFKPLAHAYAEFETEKNKAMAALSKVRKQIKASGLNLMDEAFDGLTNDQAIRLHFWQKRGYIKGNKLKGIDAISDKLGIKASNYIRSLDGYELLKLGGILETIYQESGQNYPEPTQNWRSHTILHDLLEFQNEVKRKEIFEGFFNNLDALFGDHKDGKLVGPQAMRLQGALGKQWTIAMSDMIRRLKTGRNRVPSKDPYLNAMLDWTNAAVGTTMFINSRSALLQTISHFNFINGTDNNVIEVGKAYVNGKQFMKDFLYILNSPYLQQRRAGLKIDVNLDELSQAVEGLGATRAQAVISAILKKGFLPTQFADSFAIAFGGAPFLRNRTNRYIKEGMTKEEAFEQAFSDMKEISDLSQQSSRPDKISMQQASGIGRLILSFQNYPMQAARLQKRAAQDFLAGRGDNLSHMRKIIYYGIVQSAMFHILQKSAFALLWDPEIDDEEEEKRIWETLNGIADSTIAGSGFVGMGLSAVKNVTLESIEEAQKDRPDFDQAIAKGMAFSPTISAKYRMFTRSFRRWEHADTWDDINKYDLNNPILRSTAEMIEFSSNLPANRVIMKLSNIEAALDDQTRWFESVFLMMGWNKYNLFMEDWQMPEIKPLTPQPPRKTIKERTIKKRTVKKRTIN